MEQLIQLFYPQHSLVQHCMRKKSWRASSSSSSFSTSSTSPISRPGSEDFWVPLREEALYRVDGTLGVILEEIQRTSCLPREVCVEVAKEYPQSTSQFYLPRCVSLHRCGGCCTNEAFYCTNTSFTLVNKTLMELSPPRMDRSVTMVTFVNHTSCECLSKRPLHSIIRRSAPDHLCSPPERPCASGSLWDPLNCMCVSVDALGFSQREMGECQCEGRGEGKFCPAGQRWDDELCGCVCAAACPRNQPLNPDTCLCECRESPQSCLRQGMRFNSSTCSCYRRPCRSPKRVCQPEYYYNYRVCQCIPNFMKWN
uniref:Platelet-derived growth factor (PDGF) family profile domain-containing protein n=1 Tax=Oryzias sinensis TaxID=183150 RepID=A0A8C7YCJ4_9TELE